MSKELCTQLILEYRAAIESYEAAKAKCQVLREELRKVKEGILETSRANSAEKQIAQKTRIATAEEKKKARETRIRLANERKEAKEKARRERLIKRAIEHGFTEYL